MLDLSVAAAGVSRRTWHCPVTSDGCRDYQQRIIHAALQQNTLVYLPAGTGKSFIGFAVMYNMHRWFPTQKIVHVAPTKTLVKLHQQAFNRTFAKLDVRSFEVPPNMPPAKRHLAWTSHAILFTTPQVFENDMCAELLDPSSVVCMVMDKVQVSADNDSTASIIRMLRCAGASFRVCVLAAAVGTSKAHMQNLIDTLQIQRVEYLDEQSDELKPYISTPNSDIVIVPPNSLTARAVTSLDRLILEDHVNPLRRFGVNLCSDASKLSLESLRSVRMWLPETAASRVTGLKTLLHIRDLAVMRGPQTMAAYISMLETGGLSAASSRTIQQLSGAEEFRKVLREACLIGQSLALSQHPKMIRIADILGQYFADSSQTDARATIYAPDRECAAEIFQSLQSHQPLIRPTVLTECSSVAGLAKLTRAHRQTTLERLAEGHFNVLIVVCTEGLEVGAADLVILYDFQSFLARMSKETGASGKRTVLLVNELLEHHMFQQHDAAQREMNQVMAHAAVSFVFPSTVSNPVASFCSDIQLVRIKLTVSTDPHTTKGTIGRKCGFRPSEIASVPELSARNYLSCVPNKTFLVAHSSVSKELDALCLALNGENRTKCRRIWKRSSDKMSVLQLYNYTPNAVSDYELFFRAMTEANLAPAAPQSALLCDLGELDGAAMSIDSDLFALDFDFDPGDMSVVGLNNVSVVCPDNVSVVCPDNVSVVCPDNVSVFGPDNPLTVGPGTALIANLDNAPTLGNVPISGINLSTSCVDPIWDACDWSIFD